MPPIKQEHPGTVFYGISIWNVAANVPELVVGEIRNGAYSFKGELDIGELLTGTPLVKELNTSDLTIGNKVINTGKITIEDDDNVLAGQAVTYSVKGHKSGKTYKLKIPVDTDATPAQKLIEYATFIGVTKD